MNPSLAADLFRDAIWTATEVGAPMLIAMTVTALVFGIFQAATQVQDSSVSFAPKLGMAVLVGWITAGWMIRVLAEFMQRALTAIPWMVAR